MSLEKFLENLDDPELARNHSAFIEVSDLSPAELGLFARAWFVLPRERRRELIATLVELAEENPELDFGAIFKMCLKDPDEPVLEKAIEGLWEYDDRSVLPGLIQVLSSEQGPAARAAAAAALGKFAALAQEGGLLTRDAQCVREQLTAILENAAENPEVRRRSLEAVAPFNTPDIRDYLCRAYESDDLKLKSSSIYGMGRTGESGWLPLLIKELKSREPSLRYETAHACGELGDEAVVPHLIFLLQDEDYQVQLAGLTALGKIGGSLAKRALLRCIKEGDAALEEAARAALENVEFLEDPLAFASDL